MSLLGGAVLCAAGLLPAQSPAAGHLVGWAWNNTSTTVCSAVYTQDLEGGCQRAATSGSSICNQKGQDGGGTAYDPRTGAVWVTNGDELVLQNVVSNQVLCRVPSAATSPWVISGLALSDARRELYLLEIGPQLLVISSYDVSTPCQPVHKRNWCRIANTGTNATGMGLAYDEARDLLYYTSSLVGIVEWNNTLHVVSPAQPCTDLASFPIRICGSRPGRPITGLGYDACTTRLYATDGVSTRVLQLTDPARGQFTDITGGNPCCAFTGTGLLMGLDVIPNWKSSTAGSSCGTGSCGSCRSLSLGLIGGDASLGNRDFGFLLDNAPQAAQGLMYLSLGSCTSGTQIPGLCGPVHTALSAPFPVLAGVFSTGGSTACGGQVRLVTGVPNDPALCKVSVCAQFLVLCSSGHALTNAVGFSVGG